MNGMTFSGIVLVVIGVLAGIGGMMMDCSVATPYGRVINLSLAHRQTMIVSTGALIGLAGVILFGFGALTPKARPLPRRGEKRAALLRKSRIESDAETPADDFLDSLR